MLARMGMLKRVLMLVLMGMGMLVLQRRVSRVESHAASQGASSAMGANHAGRVGQLVVLRAQAPEPDEPVLGDQHRRARGGRLLLVQALHGRMPAAALGAPQGLYAITVAV